MKSIKLLTFTFIVAFRGGTYCSQVQARNVTQSVIKWVKKIEIEQNQIQHMGNKVLGELKLLSKEKDWIPVPLSGLKNTWYTSYGTRQGTFSINIIQTDIQ